MPLHEFVSGFDADVRSGVAALPEAARGLAEWIVSSGTLRDYATEPGMRLALERYGARMTQRLGTSVDLVPCLADFAGEERAFAGEFDDFWRDVTRMVAEEFEATGA